MVERISETNYMFKLTHFKDKLKDYLSNHIIIPDKYENLLMKQIDSLEDLSISRESKRVFWGINVKLEWIFFLWLWKPIFFKI
jgi:methionyl-tRNA synthetase